MATRRCSPADRRGWMRVAIAISMAAWLGQAAAAGPADAEEAR